MARRHARHTAEQHTGTAGRLLQRPSSRLDGHAAGDFGHGCQQRQAAAAVGHGLISNGNAAGLHQRRSLFRVRRQMQVGIQYLPRTQHGTLDRLRLLDLDDHVGTLEDFFRSLHDLRPGGQVLLVGEADSGARIGLHQHLMAVALEFLDTGRGQPDAVFMVLNFLGYTDQHDVVSIILAGCHRRLVTRRADRITASVRQTFSTHWACAMSNILNTSLQTGHKQHRLCVAIKAISRTFAHLRTCQRGFDRIISHHRAFTILHTQSRSD